MRVRVRVRGGERRGGERRGGTASCIGCAAAGVVLQDWATVSPDARSAEAPRCELVRTVHHARVECVFPCAAHVPDAGSHMGPRSRMLYLTVIVLLLVVVVGGGAGYFLYSRKKEKERKRFY